MSKGRTNNAIRILVAPQFLKHPSVLSWIGQGHQVESLDNPDLLTVDLILHPAAHFWNEDMFQASKKKDGTVSYPYADAAIQKGRANKKRRKI